VNYLKRKGEGCIEYRTTREVGPGEELCIFYGHTLWFVDRSAEMESGSQIVGLKLPDDARSAPGDDPWGGLGGLSI
jgi:tRNA-specific adenosine deaminase 3